MNRFIVLVAALALANGEMVGQVKTQVTHEYPGQVMGQSKDNLNPMWKSQMTHEYPAQVMGQSKDSLNPMWKNQMTHEYPGQVGIHPGMQYPGYEHMGVDMGSYQMPGMPYTPTYQVPYAPKTTANWMGICDGLCRDQMATQGIKSIHDISEEKQHANIGQLMDHLEVALQKVGPEVSMEEITSNVHQLVDQILYQKENTQSVHLQHVFQEYQNIMDKSNVGAFGAHVDVKNVAQQEVLRELRTLFIHEHGGRQNFTAYIQRPLEATIMAHVAVQTVHKKDATEHSEEFHKRISDAFHFDIEELVEKSNILRTELLLNEFQTELKQIDLILHFLHQQMRTLEIYELMQKMHPEDFQGNQQQLFEMVNKKMHEYQHQMTIRKLALQMVIRSFEKVLLSQEGTMEQVTIERMESVVGAQEKTFLSGVRKYTGA